ncbi:cupin domain-containing protein [Fodinisporobacter ferrooxydans]|uniref:Cupin domain-containing protein n=1 Tax=Fodinisporobacter ferrooxydans TaxID=2901836 RepID=A0ABY4CEJ7_9BACL|nr:cupin domain-containing protein [Alicyclobacillaceae bacterium MYW30-H2]
MFFIFIFLISWASFLLFSNKKRIHELYQSSLIGMMMSLTSDAVTSFHPFWFYNDPETHLSKFVIQMLDDFGVYPVISYLYIQYMPNSVRKWLKYTWCWTLAGITIEYMMVNRGYITHQLGWSLSLSYISDWIIFGLLTLHHQWIIRSRKFPNISFIQNGKVEIFFEETIHPVSSMHPLYDITQIHGVTILQSVTNGNFETFIFIMESNAAIPPHCHEGYEIHYVVDGIVTVSLHDQERILKRGDIIHFDSIEIHSFKNQNANAVKLISLLMRNQEGFQQKTEVKAASAFIQPF